MERTGFYDPYSGVTNNAAESFNKVLKWMNDYKKMPIDIMILSLFYAQNSAFTEVLSTSQNLCKCWIGSVYVQR